MGKFFLAGLFLVTFATLCIECQRELERTGEVERVRSSFVGGIKRAPMRWELRAAS